ncbi:TrmO family methyltransferase [Dactylosporangium sp. NPDC049742]|uniref:TrmO family methyltransferase domain-containing protein n=1 Tax=Dactylosporangium sp. NPDC049742 TaxID=3154737 RepID=UPI003437A0F7
MQDENQADAVTVQPVAHVLGGRADVFDDAWDGVDAVIRLDGSRCRLHRVVGLDLHVSGLDAVAGTPVLDIKPYMTEFGPRGEVRQPAWSTEIMHSYY